MARLGDTVYLVCRSKTDEKLKIRGIVAEIDGEDLMVGISIGLAKEPESVLHEKTGSPQFGFVEALSSSVSTMQPAGWSGKAGGKPPLYDEAVDLWKIFQRRWSLEAAKTRLQKQKLRVLRAKDRKTSNSSDSEESEEEEKSSRRHLPLGVSSLRKKEKKEHKGRGEGAGADDRIYGQRSRCWRHDAISHDVHDDEPAEQLQAPSQESAEWWLILRRFKRQRKWEQRCWNESGHITSQVAEANPTS